MGKLIDAVNSRNVVTVQKLLAGEYKKSPKLNTETDAEGNTALVLAAGHGLIKMAQALVDAGADVNAAGTNGTSPLHNAAVHGHVDVVTLLLDSGAKAEKLCKGFTAVHLAAAFDQARIIEVFADKGVSLDMEEPNQGATALVCAVQKGSAKAARALLLRGADSSKPLKSGASAYHVAIEQKQDPILEIMLQHYPVGVLLSSPQHGTVLKMARATKQPRLIKLAEEAANNAMFAAITKDNGVSEDYIDRALAAGISVNARGGVVVLPHGRVREIEEFAIVYAIQEANGVAVQKLVQAGANLDVRCNRGFSLIDTAMIRGEAACVRPLLEASPGLLGAASKYGGNLLHMAILMLSPYSLIEHSQAVEGPELSVLEQREQLQQYYQGKISVEGISDYLETRAFVYRGNLPLIRLLVELNPGLIIAKRMDGVSPLDIAQNPRKHIDSFYHAGGVCTEDNLLNINYSSVFQASIKGITICNRESQEQAETEVSLSFLEVQKLFEQKVQKMHYLSTEGGAAAVSAPVMDADQIQALSVQVLDVCGRDSSGESAKSFALEVDARHPYCRAISDLHKKSGYRKLFYDTVSMGLFLNLGIEMLRAGGERYKGIIEKFEAMEGEKYQFEDDDRALKLFFKAIAPNELLGFCQEVAFFLTEGTFRYLNQLKTCQEMVEQPDDLSLIPTDNRTEVVLKLANLVMLKARFGVFAPAHGIVEIDESLSPLGSRELLLQDVMHWVFYGTCWAEQVAECLPVNGNSLLFSFKPSKDSGYRSDFNITRRLSTVDVESENFLRSYLFSSLPLPEKELHKPNGRTNGHRKKNGVQVQPSVDDGKQEAKRKGGCVVQ